MKKPILLTLVLCFLLTVLSCGTAKSIKHQPQLIGYNNSIPTVVKKSPTVFYSGNNSFSKTSRDPGSYMSKMIPLSVARK